MHRMCALKPSRGRVPWWNATDLGGPPLVVQLMAVNRPSETTETMRRHRLLTVANLVGLPSVAVPTGVVDGVPQGVQVIGPYLGDELCLAAAMAIEQSLATFTPINPVTGPELAVSLHGQQRPRVRKSVPGWAFMLGAGDGNRTRTVSLGS